MTRYLTESDLDEAERHFAGNVGKPPLTEAEKVRAFLSHRAQHEQREPNRAERVANLSKLSQMINAAVDGAKTRGGT